MASAAASPSGLPASPIAAMDQQYNTGFYVTGGKIIDLSELLGEPFEHVVARHTGAQWEFGYDGTFRFVPADGGPVLTGSWKYLENQGAIQIEAYHFASSFEGQYEAAMQARIEGDGTARVEQATRTVQYGEALGSYAKFTIVLY